MTRLFTLLLMLVVAANTALAQHPDARAIAFKHVQASAEKMGLLPADVADLSVSDLFPTAHNGVTHVWLQQRHEGIPVYLGLYQVAVKKDGAPVQLPHRFARDLAHKVNSLDYSVSVSAALKKSLQSIDYQGVEPRALTNPAKGKFTFGEAPFGRDITADLVFQPMKNGRASLPNDADALRLAWAFQIQVKADHHLWAIRVDAITGEILKKEDLASSCDFGKRETFDGMSYIERRDCVDELTGFSPEKNFEQKTVAFNGAAATYNVWALPTEAPNDGPRVVLTDPADPVASPFGWHDTNGSAGAEFTTTRGNNVNAYQDQDGNDAPATPNDQPNGGAGLNFDAPFNPDEEPENQSAAGVINLFYMQNTMHDFAHHYGMDSPGGAFQTNNYGNGGLGNDPVNAEARDGQFAANPSVNNANFTPSIDGIPGKTQMFVWDRSAAVGGNLKVNAPSNVAGIVETTTSNGWGGDITDVPVTGLVEIVDDGSQQPTLGCNTLTNNLAGKIALVDRQVCEFGKKALNAQTAGAIACIICNFENGLINMGAGAVGAQVTIPVVMIKKIDCDIIRQYAGSGLEVSLVQPTVSGPDKLDGDLDNGIIAHEYGHGISNRLVGGPSVIGCISNAEQMGEGISDLMDLFTTAKATDKAETPQGVGTYVQREDAATGKGIRSYPYSTDLTVNPLTYGDVALNTEVHAVGEVWTAAMWEVYWAMTELYGFDANLYTGTGGNNKAIRLMFDAMKLAPCGPGFVDLRDAFFTADELNFNGIHRCLISEAFAKRGIGIDAQQGDPDSAGDQVEDFNPIATCIAELKIKKSVDKDLINAGDIVTFTIDVVNHKPDAVTNTVVKDILPAGLTYVAGSATGGGNFTGGNMVWDLGTLASGDSKKLIYKALSSSTIGSFQQWIDNMENGDNNWSIDITTGDGSVLWGLQEDLAHSGKWAWYAGSTEADLNIFFYNDVPLPVTGTRPVMRFWHKYDTEAGADGGFIEISTNGGTQWGLLPKSKYIRRGPGDLNYGTFALANLAAWSGTSAAWIDSYLDLSSYAGQSIQLRWRYGCDDQVAVDGWYVDDIELMDLFKYDTEATITSAEGDNVSAKVPAEGVFVNPTNGGGSATGSPSAAVMGLEAQPNPVDDILWVSLTGEKAAGDSRISLFAADGRLVKTARFDFQSASQKLPVDVSALEPGIYMLRVEGATGTAAVKVAIK